VRGALFCAIAFGAASSVAACSLLTSTSGLTGGEPDPAPLSESAAPTEDAGAREDSEGPDAAAPESEASAAPDAAAPDSAAGGGGDSAADTTSEASAEADAPSSAYRAAVLADAPIAYWRFGEASGATAHDETGHGNDATIGTGVTWGAPGALVGDPNTAIHLAGTQGLTAGNVFAFPGNLPYSLEAWVSLDTALDNNYRHLFSEDDETPAAGREEYGVYFEVDDGLAFERYVTGQAEKVIVGAPPLNQWTHVVSTYDGANLSLYVNGQEVGVTLDERSQASMSVPEYLGCKSFQYVSVQGFLDEFAIYDQALSAGQVAGHWAASGQ
jgi:hypothetical protein